MISIAPRILPERIRIKGCAIAAIIAGELEEAALRTGTDSDARPNAGAELEVGIKRRCDAGLAAFFRVSLGS